MAEGKLTELDPQYLSNYYGIDTTDLDEYVFAQSDTPESSAETIIIIKSEDTSKFEDYKTSFENQRQVINQLLSYPKDSAGTIMTTECYILYAVFENVFRIGLSSNTN